MTPKAKPLEGERELVVIAEQSGQMQPRDFNTVPEVGNEGLPAVPIVERNIHLQNAITYLVAVSMRASFIRRDNSDIAARRRHAIPGHRKNVENEQSEFARMARESFIKATGNEALLAAGLLDETDYKDLNRQMFSDFMKKYSSLRHYKQTQAYRRLLIDNNQALQTVTQTEHNRANKLRPHRRVSKKGEKRTPEAKAIDTVERLRAIVEDPRAGFIPTTNREKNQVLTFLDYLDNPEFPFGVNNQFWEVFNHSQVIRRRNQAIDSTRGPLSIVYELGDYFANATAQVAALQSIERALLELPNQKVRLGEEHDWIDLQHPGFAALVRYRDLREFISKGSLPTIKDPLLTQEDRWTREGPGKHKRVEDRYTAVERPKTFNEHVNQSISAITVGEARQLIGLAIEDQLKRQAFMHRVLEDIAIPPISMRGKSKQVLQSASEAALQIIGEYQAA